MTVYTNDVSAANPDADTIRENNRDFENVINGGLKSTHFSASRKMAFVPVTISFDALGASSTDGFITKMRRAGVIRRVYAYSEDAAGGAEMEVRLNGTLKWSSAFDSPPTEKDVLVNIAYAADDILKLTVTIANIQHVIFYLELFEVTDR